MLRKALRPNVALAIDGGGIKGVMVARALMRLEEEMDRPISEIVSLASGTSTGAIIAAGIARGLTAKKIHDLYVAFGDQVFPKTWRTLFPFNLLVRYQYSSDRLIALLDEYLGSLTMGELYRQRPGFHLVITATDIYANETRFIKLYKARFHDWLLRDVVMASSIVPTVFPVYEHEYRKKPADPPKEAWIPDIRYWIDGGVGSYSNPAFMAAYEIAFCLRDQGWNLENTTLLSFGTGSSPLKQVWDQRLNVLGFKRTPRGFFAPEWIFPSIDTFVHDAARQQAQLVRHFFQNAPAERAGSPNAGLDFRRYNVEFEEVINMDDASKIGVLSEKYGRILGQNLIDDVQEDFGAFACGGGEAFETRDEDEPRAQAV